MPVFFHEGEMERGGEWVKVGFADLFSMYRCVGVSADRRKVKVHPEAWWSAVPQGSGWEEALQNTRVSQNLIGHRCSGWDSPAL
jgi:hypothetical protein